LVKPRVAATFHSSVLEQYMVCSVDLV